MSLPEAGTVDIISVYLPAHDSTRLFHILSTDERQRADRFRFEADRRRYIISHAFLRLHLAAYLDTDPRKIAFELGAHGKPYITDTGLRFNLSHSGDVAAMAFADGMDVGIDVECFRRRLNDPEGIARRFFSETEFQAYLAAQNRELTFFRIWTRKEAFIKATGEGMQRPLSSFVVSAGELACLLSLNGSESAARDWSMFEATPFEDHLLTVAVGRSSVKFLLKSKHLPIY